MTQNSHRGGGYFTEGIWRERPIAEFGFFRPHINPAPRAPARTHTKRRGGSQRPETYLRITRTPPSLVKAATDPQNPRFCCFSDLELALAGNSDAASAAPSRWRLAVRRGNIPHASKVARDEARRQLYVDFVNASWVSALRDGDRLQTPHFYSGFVPCKPKNFLRQSCHREVLSLGHMARAPCHLDKPKLGFRTLHIYCQSVSN